MSSFDPQPELDGALRRLARTSGRGPFAEDEIWALAAGELSPEVAAEAAARVLANRRAALEFAYASHVFDDRTAIDIDAARQSADRVLAAIRAGQRPVAARRAAGRFGPGLLLAVAALLIAALVWFRTGSPATEVSCTVASLDSAPLRSASGLAGIRYRLQLQPATASHVALFVLSRRAAGFVVKREFPVHPRALEANDSPYRGWPVNPLPAATTLLPPATAAPFEVPVAAEDGVAVALVVSSAAPFDEGTVAAILLQLQAAAKGLTGAVSVAAAEVLTAPLRARGFGVRTVLLKI